MAIITGAASGIGKALACELASQGCQVVVADRQITLAKQVVDDITQGGGKAWAYEIDVTDYNAVQQLVDTTISRSGTLDFMFNNAGIGHGGLVEDYTLEDWEGPLKVNLQGVINGIQACYPRMIEQGYGHIINTSSISGLVPSAGFAAYTASKFAVTGLSQALKIEAETHGINVTLLCPGSIDTPILEGGVFGSLPKGLTPEKARASWGNLPISPDDYAKIALKQIAKNKAIIINPAFWAVLYWVYRFSWKVWYREAKKLFIKTKADWISE